MTLVERDALLLADMLADENSGEVDPDAVRHLVSEANGYPTALRRAYEQVYRRWTVNRSPRDLLACQLLRRAQHTAAAEAAAEDAVTADQGSTASSGIFVDWSHDDRPVWQVSVHCRRSGPTHEPPPPDLSAEIASQLRQTGMTRQPRVTVDPRGADCELSFRVRAKDGVGAQTAAEGIARTCLNLAGAPFWRSVSARAAIRCEFLQVIT